MIEQLITNETFLLAKQAECPIELPTTQSILHKWIRENYDIDIYIEPVYVNNTKKYEDHIISDLFLEEELRGDDFSYNTYEEAYEKGLVTALNLIIRIKTIS